MVKTFFTDFPISVFLGLLFSMFKADVRKSDPFYRFLSFWAGLLVWSFYAYTSIIAYQQWPHWMWMYLLEPPVISSWGWIFVYIVLYGIPFLTGFLIGSHGRQNSWMSLWVVFGASVGGTLAFTIEMWDRYSVIIDSLDYTSDKAVHIFDHGGYQFHLLGSAAVVAAYCVLCWLFSRRYYLRQLEKGRIKKHLLHPAKQRTLQKIAEAILPPAPDLRSVSGKDMPYLAETISAHLADLNFINRVVIRLAIDFINLSPLFFAARPLRLENLPMEKQVEILDKIDNNRIFEIKMPLKLIKMFVLQFYYEDQRVLDHLGYKGESLGIFRKKLRWLNRPEHS